MMYAQTNIFNLLTTDTTKHHCQRDNLTSNKLNTVRSIYSIPTQAKLTLHLLAQYFASSAAGSFLFYSGVLEVKLYTRQAASGLKIESARDLLLR
jgi:hypothetical protein